MHKAFTLIEVLIAISLFTLVAIISARIFADIVQLEKKTSVQNPIYDDAATILQQITKEIQGGTIDYEEYYSINVVQKKKLPDGGPFYGINYGVYSSRFYDPGKSHYPPPNNLIYNPDDLGIECSFPDPLPDDQDCEVYYTNSSDLNTGQNPFKKSGSNPNSASAFCDENFGISCAAVSNTVDSLYLIDSSGTHKTILGKKKINDLDYAISVVRMTGHDLDQNGIIDVFGCDNEFKCFNKDGGKKIADAIKYPFVTEQADPQAYLESNNIRLPQQSDLIQTFDINTTQFIPITPARVTVKDLKFIINPLDDPYKAYAESNKTHSTVTIMMTLGLSSEAKKNYPGDFQDLILQSTVAAGVIGKIDSYPPVNDVLRNKNDCSWIIESFGKACQS